MARESSGEATAAPPVVGEPAIASVVKPRAYQQEMLAESLRQNTIVAVSLSLVFTYMIKTNGNEDGNRKWKDTNVRPK
jgi:hypothetical protein